MHWGGIVVAPGYTDEVKFDDGNPYGAGKVTGDTTELEDADLDAIDHLVTRALHVADRLAAAPAADGPAPPPGTACARCPARFPPVRVSIERAAAGTQGSTSSTQAGPGSPERPVPCAARRGVLLVRRGYLATRRDP